MTERINETLNALEIHTASSVRKYQKQKLPIIINSKQWLNDNCEEYTTHGVVYPVKYFYYNDKCFSYRNISDNNKYDFGILKINNMPLNKFCKRFNKKSFILDMNNLIDNYHCEPFVIFINGRFVNWNNISIVFNNGDIYLLLYGSEYDYHTLSKSKIDFMVLPFQVLFIGYESDNHFDMMYEIYTSFIQSTLYTKPNGSIAIRVPSIDESYYYKGMIYNIGYWIYTQLKYIYYGNLSQDRINRLKYIKLDKYEYDDNGEVSNIISTRFNSIDTDSYDNKRYLSLINHDISYYNSHKLFSFSNNGEYSENGNNIISVCGDDISTYNISSSDSVISEYVSGHDGVLFRENYLVFRNNLFESDLNIPIYPKNNIIMDNPNQDNYNIIAIWHNSSANAITNSDNFNTSYINTKAKDNISSNVELYNTDIANMSHVLIKDKNIDDDYISKSLVPFDINGDDKLSQVINYNPSLLNSYYEPKIKSVVMTGAEVNKLLDKPFMYESRRGLKIARDNCRYNETYVLVFENGELIKEYNEIYIYPNFLYIPLRRDFHPSSYIEFLYFNDINNNDITFYSSDNLLNRLSISDENNDFTDCTNIAKPYIKNEDLHIFCDYPYDIMEYRELVDESDSLAFDITYRDSNNNPCIPNILLDLEKDYEFTASSSRKFVYQRLHTDQKAYRLQLDARFKFCSNQRQFVLFINGRRMRDESFLITIPKHTRPFWGMYLYTAKFVGPDDRIELFYLPDELKDINKNNQIELQENGYIEFDKSKVNIPFDNSLYMVFINGKKIPPMDLITIDTHTFRLNRDPQSTYNVIINPLCIDPIEEVKNNMNDETSWSLYDNIIRLIKSTDSLGYAELNRLFNSYVSMSNIESSSISKANVDKIAIINEVVRDFWVSSGYQYNENKFIYDYEIDDRYMIKDLDINSLNIPALDATQIINVIKKDIHLLYFTTEEDIEYYEIGSSIDPLVLYWEYSKNLYGDYNIIRQTISYRLDNIEKSYNLLTNDRYWISEEPINSDISVKLSSSTSSDLIESVKNIVFTNGIFYGNVDEDRLDSYNQNIKTAHIQNIAALLPKSGIIPSYEEQNAEDEYYTYQMYREFNDIIDNLGNTIINTIETEIWNNELINIYDINLIAICQNGKIIRNIIPSSISSGIPEYLSNIDLHSILTTINKKLDISPEVTLKDYVIGNNNYFIYTCPRRLAYNGSTFLLDFILPDPNSKEIQANCRDDRTTPIYTSGKWSIQDNNQLEKLYKMEMVYLGDYIYTNDSGYSEEYCMWRTNGFFTRLFDDYKMDITIRYKVDAEVYDDGLGHIINTLTDDMYIDDPLSVPLEDLTNDSVTNESYQNNLDKPVTTTTKVNNFVEIDGLLFL